MKRTSILHIELRELHIEAIPGPIRHLCLACCPVDSLTKTTVMMTKWYISSWNSSDSNALCFFYKKKKKKTLFTTLCCVVFTVFVALLSRAIKASAEVACADEMMTRCCICTRRRKTKEVEVKLESSTAQQPTAIPAGHVERPPWKEKKKKEAFFFFFLSSALNGRFRPSTLVSRNHRDGDQNLEAVPLFCFRVVGRAWGTFIAIFGGSAMAAAGTHFLSFLRGWKYSVAYTWTLKSRRRRRSSSTAPSTTAAASFWH